MNFAALPPEVNSALMYTGAGSGPIIAAATAWDAMAAELASAAGSYQSVIAGLADESWRGPASVSMAAAAAPYAAWMSSTAAQAEQAATQAKAAALAYETAFAMTVPPPVIAANRAQLAALVATNFLGQNTAAIAATEALYAEMWAQDAAAMYGYAGNAAAATTLTSFTAPKQNTNPGGLGNQTASAMQTAGTSAGAHAQTAASQLTAVPHTLQGLTQPLQSAGAGTAAGGGYEGAGAPGLILDLLVAELEVGTIAPFEGGGGGIEFAGLAIEAAALGPFSGGIGGISGLGLIGDVAPAGGLGGLSLAGGVGPMTGLGAAGGTGATWASIGKAASLGSLSVPQAWAAAAPSAIHPVALVSAESSAGVASAVAAGGSEAPMAEMALASMAGRAMAGSAGRGGRERPATTTRERQPAPSKPPDDTTTPDRPATGIEIVAELRGLAELRDSGILTAEEFNKQRERLIESVN
ncbi:MAG TPA: PPE domain-containing protein [Mycobacterium sp.]|nr:PPE domain-containing protein [Mycobacterium sp.]